MVRLSPGPVRFGGQDKGDGWLKLKVNMREKIISCQKYSKNAGSHSRTTEYSVRNDNTLKVCPAVTPSTVANELTEGYRVSRKVDRQKHYCNYSCGIILRAKSPTNLAFFFLISPAG